MSLYKVRHYVVYRNEVLFVNPAEWPDGKWRRLHDAEREMGEADGMLAGAIRARRRFKDDVRNGRYPGGPIGTEMAIDADRRTRHAMEAARHRAVRAAEDLYGMLVGLGTITEDEAMRRIGAVMSWGAEYEG
jgi:hypothetical protein